MNSTALTITPPSVSEKTNEIPVAKEVLLCLPMHPRVYTADTLHTHAAFMTVAQSSLGAM